MVPVPTGGRRHQDGPRELVAVALSRVVQLTQVAIMLTALLFCKVQFKSFLKVKNKLF